MNVERPNISHHTFLKTTIIKMCSDAPGISLSLKEEEISLIIWSKLCNRGTCLYGLCMAKDEVCVF